MDVFKKDNFRLSSVILSEFNSKSKKLLYIFQFFLYSFIALSFFLYIYNFFGWTKQVSRPFFYLKINMLGNFWSSLIFTCCFMILIFFYSFLIDIVFEGITKIYQIIGAYKRSFFYIVGFLIKFIFVIIITLAFFYFLIIFFSTGSLDIHEFIQKSHCAGNSFLKNNYIEAKRINNLHFQNIIVLYIPLFISWICTLFIMSYRNIFRRDGLIVKGLENKVRLRLKDSKKLYMDLYLIYFIRSIIVQFPFPFIVGFIMHFILFIFPIFNIIYPGFFFERFQYFSGQVAYPSFLSSMIILFLTPVVSSYFNLGKSYNIYTDYHAKNKVKEKLNDHFLIMGYGNLAGNIIRHTIKSFYVYEEEKSIRIRKEMFKFVEIIIDGNMLLKAIVLNFVVINKTASPFRQKFSSSRGIDFGFVEALSSDHDLWLLGILGDASNTSILDAANYKKSRLIINATPDERLPIKVFKLIKDKKSILSVPDSASFLSLINKSINKDIFLVFPSLIGSISVANILFLFFEKLKVKVKADSLSDFFQTNKFKEILMNNQILIMGQGRELFYTLERVKSILSHELREQEERIKLIEESCIIFSDDKNLKHNLNFIAIDRGYWEVSLDRYGGKVSNKYKLLTYFQNPLNLEKVNSVFEDPRYDSQDRKIGLIIIFDKTQTRCLKILKNIQNVIKFRLESGNIKDRELPLILISTPRVEKELVRDELRAFEQLSKDDKKIFPTQRNTQLIHDYTVADEVAAIFRTWMVSTKQKKNDLSDPFSISLCINDKPGILTRCLLLLSGFDISNINTVETVVPSFHNSNTLIDRDNLDAYIFEGIASLESIDNEIPLIHGYSINSSEKSLNRINKTVDTLFMKYLYEKYLIQNLKEDSFDCPGCCSVCPISVLANPYDYKRFYNKGRLKLYKVKPDKPDNNGERHYGQILIYGDKASCPGSLALGLKDLLFISWNEIEQKNEDLSNIKDLVNIKYLSNIECPEKSDRTLRSLYGVIQSTCIYQQRELLRKGTLNAICIKAAEINVWSYYAEKLNKFLNDSYRKYGKQYIYEKKLNEKYPYIIFIVKKDLGSEILRKILLKMDIFWKENEKEFQDYFSYLKKITNAK